MSYDFKSPRLFVESGLSAGGRVAADANQTNYLLNVLRLKDGGAVLLFNGRDGEWRARIVEAKRKACALAVEEKLREQTPLPDLHYLFAPLKHARLDYMVQKAVEMGAGRLSPVLTEFTQVGRVNLDRMRANVIEAAEQCGVLALPAIDPPKKLAAALADWDAERRLIFCDEAAPTANPAEALKDLPRGPAGPPDRPGGRILRKGARRSPRPALRHGAVARAPHPQGRHSSGRGDGACPIIHRRLAIKGLRPPDA